MMTVVVPQVTASSVDGALIGGDLARLKGLPEDYARLKTMLAPIVDKMPVGMVLGNHDHRANFRVAFAAASLTIASRVTLSKSISGGG